MVAIGNDRTAMNLNLQQIVGGALFVFGLALMVSNRSSQEDDPKTQLFVNTVKKLPSPNKEAKDLASYVFNNMQGNPSQKARVRQAIQAIVPCLSSDEEVMNAFKEGLKGKKIVLKRHLRNAYSTRDTIGLDPSIPLTKINRDFWWEVLANQVLLPKEESDRIMRAMTAEQYAKFMECREWQVVPKSSKLYRKIVDKYREFSRICENPLGKVDHGECTQSPCDCFTGKHGQENYLKFQKEHHHTALYVEVHERRLGRGYVPPNHLTKN